MSVLPSHDKINNGCFIILTVAIINSKTNIINRSEGGQNFGLGEALAFLYTLTFDRLTLHIRLTKTRDNKGQDTSHKLYT